MDNNVFDVKKIMERYGVGVNSAYKIMKSIEIVNGGLSLSRGRILLSEIEYYEKTRGGRDKV